MQWQKWQLSVGLRRYRLVRMPCLSLRALMIGIWPSELNPGAVEDGGLVWWITMYFSRIMCPPTLKFFRNGLRYMRVKSFNLIYRSFTFQFTQASLGCPAQTSLILRCVTSEPNHAAHDLVQKPQPVHALMILNCFGGLWGTYTILALFNVMDDGCNTHLHIHTIQRPHCIKQ